MSSHPSRKSPAERSAAVRLAASRAAARAVDTARALPHALPRALPHPLPGTRPPAGPYAVFHGPHRRKALCATGAGTLLLGIMLAAAPGSAAAQTVQPTTPGTSAFTAPHVLRTADTLVQVGEPTAYRFSGGAYASQRAVTVAANLAPETPPAPAAPAEPAPAPAAAPAAEPPPAPAWSAPVPGAPISNPFGEKNSAYAAGYHTGTDFAVPSGTPVHAVGEATVVSAVYDGAYGNEIVLRLTDGRFALYAHLSAFGVHAGQSVTAGQQIGNSGSTGNSTGPHLHFEIRTANSYGAVTDPVHYLSGHGVSDF